MKSLLAILILSLAWSGPAWAAIDDRAAVEHVLRDNLKAFAAGDFAAMEQLWAHDEDLRVFESGHANQGWKDYSENHLKPELVQLKGIKVDPSDIQVRLAGKTAWVTYKYSYSLTVKEKTISGNAVATAVLEKRAGRWPIVHSHSSSVRSSL
jgi:uncharacterized protein (TIGR02246 family)